MPETAPPVGAGQGHAQRQRREERHPRLRLHARRKGRKLTRGQVVLQVSIVSHHLNGLKYRILQMRHLYVRHEETPIYQWVPPLEPQVR